MEIIGVPFFQIVDTHLLRLFSKNRKSLQNSIPVSLQFGIIFVQNIFIRSGLFD